jgi:DNA-binding transcriptional LysR family regulator
VDTVDRLAAMETFVCVVDAGSFSGAARLRHIKQPTVSKSIAQLEERLGIRLLFRTTRGLVPTEAGQQFYERARVAIDQAREAESAARASAGGLTGRLRVCVPITVATLKIIPFLGVFMDEHRELVVDMVLSDENIDLLENGIDLALRLGDLQDSSMTARRLAQERRIVVGTPSYIEAYGEPKVPAELAGHQTIVSDPGRGGSVWAFRRDGAEVSVAVTARFRTTVIEGIRAAVLGNLGLAVVPEWTFKSELASGVVVPVLADWTLPSIDVWALFPTGRRPSAKVRAFTAFVEEVLNQVGKSALVQEDCGHGVCNFVSMSS